MYLHEYQSKQLFSSYGLLIPDGYICKTKKEIEYCISNILKGPWIVKCQIHGGSRGKSGGVKKILNKNELLNFSNNWFKKRLITSQTDSKGQFVNSILIEPVIDFLKEFYLCILVDRTIHSIVFILSTEGGVDIEEQTNKKKKNFYKIIVDMLVGPQQYQVRNLAYKIGLVDFQVIYFNEIFIKLISMFIDCDLELLEINPLVITKDNLFICLDGKLSIDDNAIFRQNDLFKIYDKFQKDKKELYTSKLGLNYIKLNGNIGCMVNGAGLAMSTMDMIKLYGGEPANFLDIGGGVTKDKIIKAFNVIISDKKVKVLFINIFGGIVRCDLISDGIICAILKFNVSIPIVVRLEGTNSDLAIKKLLSSGLNINTCTNMSNAFKKVVFYSKE